MHYHHRALAAIRATGALKEVLSVEDVAEVIQDNYARILSLLIVRIGCTAGVKPKDKLDPNGFAVECLKTFIVASKSTFIETELQVRGRVVREPPTGRDGACVVRCMWLCGFKRVVLQTCR